LRGNFKGRDQNRKKVNEAIRASKIRLIDEKGEQIGIVDLMIGLQRARDKNLDLVEIGESDSLPVCRIMDYGKFQYKKKKQQKKKTDTHSLKELKFRPKIDTHDYDFKIKNGRQFLENGHQLKISLVFRGRELQFKEKGLELFYKVIKDLEDYGQTVDEVKITGRTNSILLSPIIKKSNENKNKV
jgi:translation initiation factor IF-3